ncbi:MAG: hypothetical protein GF320_13315, partial [Armatimonadia bacterium]|nr:hypothetical protein [Armatimonadia bacterium]
MPDPVAQPASTQTYCTRVADSEAGARFFYTTDGNGNVVEPIAWDPSGSMVGLGLDLTDTGWVPPTFDVSVNSSTDIATFSSNADYHVANNTGSFMRSVTVELGPESALAIVLPDWTEKEWDEFATYLRNNGLTAWVEAASDTTIVDDQGAGLKDYFTSKIPGWTVSLATTDDATDGSLEWRNLWGDLLTVFETDGPTYYPEIADNYEDGTLTPGPVEPTPNIEFTTRAPVSDTDTTGKAIASIFFLDFEMTVCWGTCDSAWTSTIFAAAGQFIPENGFAAGTVVMSLDGSILTVTVNLDDGYSTTTCHIGVTLNEADFADGVSYGADSIVNDGTGFSGSKTYTIDLAQELGWTSPNPFYV